VEQLYFDSAKQLGEILAKNNIHCIYGGGSVGLMGNLADAVLSNNGTITGIIPRFMCELEWNHTKLTELVLVETMHERKEQMMRTADVAIAMPGGIGTFEELFEAITWRKLGLFNKPIIIVNTNNYFQHLIAILEKAVEDKFMQTTDLKLWTVVNNPQELLDEIKKH
jgi:uncharacterized protein (TIGR00730 family)